MPFPKIHIRLRSRTLIGLLTGMTVIALPTYWVSAQNPAGLDFPGLDRLPVIRELPDPFLMNDGKRVSSKEDWAALLEFADFQFFNKKVEAQFNRLAFAEEPGAFSWSAPKAK